MTSKLPTHPNPNNVEIPMVSTMHAQARPDLPLDKEEINDRWHEKEEQDEKLQ